MPPDFGRAPPSAAKVSLNRNPESLQPCLNKTLCGREVMAGHMPAMPTDARQVQLDLMAGYELCAALRDRQGVRGQGVAKSAYI